MCPGHHGRYTDCDECGPGEPCPSENLKAVPGVTALGQSLQEIGDATHKLKEQLEATSRTLTQLESGDSLIITITVKKIPSIFGTVQTFEHVLTDKKNNEQDFKDFQHVVETAKAQLSGLISQKAAQARKLLSIAE